jgi:type 1 glutamine amidotransferase
MTLWKAWAVGLALAVSAAWGQPLQVAFVTGDHEYRSEFSMPMIARILEAHHGMKTSVAYAKPSPQTEDNVEGLEALADADLAVFYLRWRVLPDDQLAKIVAFLHTGRPIVGIRTATHSFNYPKGHPQERWNDAFGIDVFGQKWLRHHGHMSTTRVTVAPNAEGHPILRGVPAEMTVPSWLYVVNPLFGDAKPLMIGHAIDPQRGVDHGPQPVAWTKTYNGAPVFFMTLGHPEDFKQEGVRKLLVNGIFWALGRDVPKDGANVEIAGVYEPPESGVPK